MRTASNYFCARRKENGLDPFLCLVFLGFLLTFPLSHLVNFPRSFIILKLLFGMQQAKFPMGLCLSPTSPLLLSFFSLFSSWFSSGLLFHSSLGSSSILCAVFPVPGCVCNELARISIIFPRTPFVCALCALPASHGNVPSFLHRIYYMIALLQPNLTGWWSTISI